MAFLSRDEPPRRWCLTARSLVQVGAVGLGDGRNFRYLVTGRVSRVLGGKRKSVSRCHSSQFRASWSQAGALAEAEGSRLRPCPHQVALPLQQAGRGAGTHLVTMGMPPSLPGSQTTCDGAASQGAGRCGEGRGDWPAWRGGPSTGLTTCPEGLPMMGSLAGSRGEQSSPITRLSGVSCGCPLADRTPGL